jgi:hypothetical protein
MEELTDFQFILFMASIDRKTNQDMKDAFRFFTHEEITINLDPPSIYVGPIEEKRIITELAYYDF